MFVVMQENATDEQIQNVIDRMVALNFTVHRSTGVMHTVLGGVGPEDDISPVEFEVLEGVREAHRIASPYKLASRSFRPGGTIVRIKDVEIGGNAVVAMAGPCSVEDEDQLEAAAEVVAAAGAKVIRGGAFKPRSSPYSFQGLGLPGVATSSQSSGPAQTAHHLRGDGSDSDPDDVRLCRHLPSRRA